MKQKTYRLCFAILSAGICISLMMGGLAGCHRAKQPAPEEMRDRAFGLIEEGRAREKAGEYKQAIDAYQQALALSPRPAIYFSLGHCYAETADYSRAEEYLNTALQMQPEYTEAKYELQRVIDLKAQSGTPAPEAPKEVKAAPHNPQKQEKKSQAQIVESEPSLVLTSQTDQAPETRIKPTPRPRVQINEEITKQEQPTPEQTPSPSSTDLPATSPTAAESSTAADSSKAAESSTVPEQEETDKEDEKASEVPGYEEVHKVLFPDRDRSGKKKKDQSDEGPFADDPTTRSAAGKLGYTGGATIALNTHAYHLDKAKGFLQIKEYDKAISEVQRALTLKPGDPEGLLTLGDAYAASRREQAAMDQYQAAIRSNPKDPRGYFKIGNLYSKNKSPESQKAARKAYEDAITLDPNYKSAYYNLGALAMQARNTDEAITYLEKVIQMDPNHVNAQLYLGILYGDYRHDSARAREHYQRYLDLGGERSAEVKKWMKALDSKKK